MLLEKTQVRCILWNIFIETLKLLNMREWLILSKINRPITTQVNKCPSDAFKVLIPRASGFRMVILDFSSI